MPLVGYEQSLTGGLSGVDNSRKFTITCGFGIAKQRVVTQTIDTQAPLRLKSSKSRSIRKLNDHTDRVVGNRALVSNLLSVHLVRNVPTFLLLIFVWHAMYAWDEALQHLYEHICVLVRIRHVEHE